ncbi:cytochrome c oxidase subunit 3 [Dyadobacter sediminis]|uniref:Cytochrome oxidase subunit III n=1 Tax=Dyadobacter sediminis TaxID=1493691 RepID=A0A5R9K7M2_9BACT|nr:cytochrome c oxidase subunit 3 [Dyadobacter sediminis]TLU89857.1 cytochrome oxidase subunit III [Dyadobacter sediminis]GGC12279.1 cytochrome oxidase subunit III [Dyadobacter sediminis]
MESINYKVEKEPQETLAMDPMKFILWLFLVSIIMLFASQTSAYLVRRAEGNWLEFEMPRIFWYSTVVLLISSIAMQWAYFAAKKDQFKQLKIAISITFVLGLAFLWMQFEGWKQLVAMNVYFVGNPSGSFFYVFTGLHGFHIISGLIVLLFSWMAAFRLKVHAKNLRRIQICATYWHFLDILWLYLFVFLLTFN